MSTWEMWDVIRTICDNSTRLSLSKYSFLPKNILHVKLIQYYPALDLSLPMPPSTIIPSSASPTGTPNNPTSHRQTPSTSMPCPKPNLNLAVYQGEPLRALMIPAKAFIPNAKGYPVLPKAAQRVVQSFIKVCSTHLSI